MSKQLHVERLVQRAQAAQFSPPFDLLPDAVVGTRGKEVVTVRTLIERQQMLTDLIAELARALDERI